VLSVSKKCLAEFAAVAANKVKSIFDRGVYLGENTYQAASVEFVRHRQTNYARSRLQKNCQKAPMGIFDSLGTLLRQRPFSLSEKPSPE
ncbi:hypothetical protein RFZ44_21860, partial [Acinetobacter sp. 163]|nr:hypothetical protein [Acinetobacter sp. 163]